MQEPLRDIGLAIIADDDSPKLLSKIERASILIACGDLHDAFILDAAERCACTTILAVKGNHDGAGAFPEPILNLHLRTVTISGVIFGGFGGAWRYKPRGNHLYEQEEVSEALSQFPAVDVFVAHNSPRGIHDRDDDVHTGFDAFRDYIVRSQPRLFIHGHQHFNGETTKGHTRVIGCYGYRHLVLHSPS